VHSFVSLFNEVIERGFSWLLLIKLPPTTVRRVIICLDFSRWQVEEGVWLEGIRGLGIGEC